VHADVADLSRLGVRLLVPVNQIGLPAGANLSEIARQVRYLLTQDVQAQFHPEMLGPLVQRRIRPVRLERVDRGLPTVEIGCLLDAPLTNADAAALGVVLPESGETVEEAQDRLRAEAPRHHAPRIAPSAKSDAWPSLAEALAREAQDREALLFRVYMSPIERPGRRPLVGYAEDIAPNAMHIFVPDRRDLQLDAPATSVQEITQAFCAVWGERHVLGLADGETRIWSGHARLAGVEIPKESPDALRLHMAFERSLKPNEIQLPT